MCEYRAHKEYPNLIRITIGGNRICYPGGVGTQTVLLELVKLVINSALSRRNVLFAAFYARTFYLETPMDRPELVQIRLDEILKEFIAE